MKRERYVTAAVAAAMGFLLSFGSVGGLADGFSLNADVGKLALVCLIFAAGAAGCSLFRWGTAVYFGISAVILGFLWRSGELTARFGALLFEISGRYDSAYGWGSLDFPAGETDLALQCIGALIAGCTSRSICRRSGGFLAATLALIPVFACFVVTDTVPGSGCLFLFLLGLILLILTGYMRTNAPDQANFLGVMAVLPTAAALGILFWAVPRESYVNRTEEMLDTAVQWVEEVPQKVMDAISGEDVPKIDVPDEVLEILDTAQEREYDLGAQGARSSLQSDIAVMEVLSDSGGVLYLRGQDYDTYTGTAWTAGTGREEDFGLGWSVAGVDAGEVTVSTRWEWDILYTPYYPGEGLTLKGGSYANKQGLTYSFGCRTLPANWRLLVTAGTAGEVDGGYLQLPEGTAWAEELLDTVLTGERTATEKADAIGRFVKQSAVYDLGTGRMPAGEEDFARWFLYESDTGYCVHFATAAAVLLRAAGVECRYVSGYLVQARAGETVTVSAAQAHAWVEYYEPSLDTWIVLEATPASADSPVEEDGRETADPTETASATLPRETETGGPDPDGDRQTQQTSETPGQTPGGEKRASGRLTAVLGWLLAVGTAAALMVGQRWFRLNLRRSRCREGAPNQRALYLWREVQIFGKMLKVPIPEILEELAQKAKFSQHTLTEQELELFENYLCSARDLCRSKPWYLKILYRWVYVLY